jgi:formylglycine-generating enzyme required for sulfatase activity
MSRPLIFISYAHEDLEHARRLYRQLEQAGFEPWLDKEKLRPGARWKFEISRAIRNSRFFLILLSKYSTGRSYVNGELVEALEIYKTYPQSDIYLIPVRLEDCQPAHDALLELQMVDMFPDWDAGLTEILRTIMPTLADEEPTGLEPQPERILFKNKEFIRIPAGPFIIGSTQARVNELQRATKNGMFSLECPQHELSLAEYYISRYPITNAEYQLFLQANPTQPVPYRNDDYSAPYNWEPKTRSYPAGKADHPVVLVSWHDAQKYCRWLGVRLPTEAEWEKAARGTDGREWPWGNLWAEERCNWGGNAWKGTSPVGKFSPQGDSPFGVGDLAGNVWEWCSSLRLTYPYSPSDSREIGQSEGERVVRGGACITDMYSVRCAARGGNYPGDYGFTVGFRVVLNEPG